ncbi:MAG: MFS transporter [Planctomycetes bacterium]|nr:MFS transporter [Planctomycetota bacterium]
MSEDQTPPEQKSPIGEIVQPFIDLARAPRALWGVNLAYVLEGMVYFGMLGYLAIHFSDFIFQGVDHSDEYSHNSVMVLTAGITIAMFFLGSVADKRGIRFALIAAFVFMLVGRVVISGAPNVFGLDPVRPGVFAGDKVTLHVTAIDTEDGNKTITEATVVANDEGGADAGSQLAIDLAAGEGIAPSKDIESRLVKLSKATVVVGKDSSWQVQYGSSPITARLLARSAKDQCVCAGAVISLKNAYVTARKKESKGETDDDESDEGEDEYEYYIRCHWSEQFGDVDSPRCVGTSDAKILEGIDRLKSGDPEIAAQRASEILRSNDREALEGRVLELVRSADPERWTASVLELLQANPVDGEAGRKADSCVRSVGDHEEMQRATKRWSIPSPPDGMASANTVSIAQLRDMDDGSVNVMLSDVYVSYVRNGAYFLQAKRDGPAILARVSPFWSSLHLVTILGILFVVIGYGMYQPAAYAAVRQFTTPKTAAMGFAMLYALMNLGGWLPSFAFMLRDKNWLGIGIPGVYWVYTGVTLLALFFTIVILSRKTVAAAIARAKAETAEIEPTKEKDKTAEKTPEKEAAATSLQDVARMPPAHMWLLMLATLGLVYWKAKAPWGLYSCAFLIVVWLVLCAVPKTGRWLAEHPLADGKFFFFIFALIPVQTLFAYNWLILPQYISRSFEGWIGEYFEIAANANPLLIFVAVPLIAATTQKSRVYNMMIYGTFIMALPAFLLVIGPYAWTLFGYLLIMTIGEAMWQPRFLQYAAEIAPEGRTGQYMGVAQLPWFLTKMLVPLLYSGWMMDKFCPAEGVKNTEMMWLIFACIAMVSSIVLVIAKPWVGKDFKTKAD